ncbi:MAG: nucleotidyltransferase domain-containing protein [Defluviitaleaceae bacterium]|nr:nucleotidyltransferase domain-containing protein [Defluviitaleaceae bacterium]
MPPIIDTPLIENVIRTASKDAAITSVYLFGSYARGEATEKSDIDIAVICTCAANVDRAALNAAVKWSDDHVSFTYVLAEDFATDDHPLHVSSSIKKEGIPLWQK